MRWDTQNIDGHTGHGHAHKMRDTHKHTTDPTTVLALPKNIWAGVGRCYKLFGQVLAPHMIGNSVGSSCVQLLVFMSSSLSCLTH